MCRPNRSLVWHLSRTARAAWSRSHARQRRLQRRTLREMRRAGRSQAPRRRCACRSSARKLKRSAAAAADRTAHSAAFNGPSCGESCGAGARSGPAARGHARPRLGARRASRASPATARSASPQPMPSACHAGLRPTLLTDAPCCLALRRRQPRLCSAAPRAVTKSGATQSRLRTRCRSFVFGARLHFRRRFRCNRRRMLRRACADLHRSAQAGADSACPMSCRRCTAACRLCSRARPCAPSTTIGIGTRKSSPRPERLCARLRSASARLRTERRCARSGGIAAAPHCAALRCTALLCIVLDWGTSLSV